VSQSLRDKAIKLLARRERSRAELQRLLDPEGERGPEVAALLDELQAQGWLSEARLAEQLVSRRRAGAGAARIRLELKRRGLSGEAVTAATVGLDAGDLAAASALWQRRFGAAAQDRSQRERQFRYLLGRGFSRSVASKVLRDAGGEAADLVQEESDG
jgi:regulatory protein